MPAEPFRVELTDPSGLTWAWGPQDAPQRVLGTALDFCLRVTRRRSRAETGLRAVGADAGRWLDVARVFLRGTPDRPAPSACLERTPRRWLGDHEVHAARTYRTQGQPTRPRHHELRPADR
ncbi:hypothetical protein [Streptomyces sp. NPDC093223]|uniref:hypothetical protein n=1 Tax=Streptomyces sp. NPDC093223 TaxID=3366033 RepID=UPI0037FE1A70